MTVSAESLGVSLDSAIARQPQVSRNTAAATRPIARMVRVRLLMRRSARKVLMVVFTLTATPSL